MASVEIRLFGSLEVVVDGQTLPISGQGERSLLAALACSAGRVVSVDRLIDDLWGEDLPARPTNALQVRVSKLRRQLGGLIATRPAGYLLEVDPEDVDVHRFTRLASRGRFKDALALPGPGARRVQEPGVGPRRGGAAGGAVPGGGRGGGRGPP